MFIYTLIVVIGNVKFKRNSKYVVDFDVRVFFKLFHIHMPAWVKKFKFFFF